MKLRKTLTKNSIYNLLGYGTLLIASFFSIPLLLNNLGSELFGAYTVLVGLVPIAATIDFGLSSALIKKLSSPNLSDKEQKDYTQTSLFLFFSLSLILSFLAYLLIRALSFKLPALSPLSSPQTTAFAISGIIFANLLSQHFLAIIQAKQRFDLYNLRVVFVGLATTIISAYASQFNPTLSFIFLVQFCFYFLGLIFTLFATSNYFSLKTLIQPRLTTASLKNLKSYGLRYFIGQIISRLRQYTSRYYLGATLSGTVVSYYSIPHSIISKLLGGITQIGNAIFPLSSYLSSKEKLPKLKKVIFKLELAFLVLGVLQIFIVWHFGQTLLTFWLSNPAVASQAYLAWRILSIFFALASLTAIPSFVLNGLGYPGVTSLFAGISTTLHIIFLFLFVPKFGFLGAAYAETTASIITAPIFLTVFSRLINQEAFRRS